MESVMLSQEQLLLEIEDLIRTMPSRDELRKDLPETYSWLGRAAALIARWDQSKEIRFQLLVRELHSLSGAFDVMPSMTGILTMIHQARHELRLTTVGPLSVVIDHGYVFDYFDEVRKVIEGASSELFIVDPYLDAEFFSRYIPHVHPGVSVRLLGQNNSAKLISAAEVFKKQNPLTIEIRHSDSLHDRFVFVDKSACYQSGASFKDGAKKSPTTLTQIIDAFVPLQNTYESLWSSAKTSIIT